MKRKPTLHMALMAVLSLATIGALIKYIIDFFHSAGKERLFNLANCILMLLVVEMLITGFVYLFQGCSKQAASYYKAFLYTHIGVCVLTIVIDLGFYTLNGLLVLISILNACKIIVLAILAFRKDLGKQKTWGVFYVLLALDVVKLILAVINMAKLGFDFSFVGYVIALIADGTIGLSIKAKYADKEARGSA